MGRGLWTDEEQWKRRHGSRREARRGGNQDGKPQPRFCAETSGALEGARGGGPVPRNPWKSRPPGTVAEASEEDGDAGFDIREASEVAPYLGL